MEYTDETPCPFGKFKGVKLGNIEPHYLLWIYDNIPNLHDGFKKYIDANRPILEMELAHKKQQRRLSQR